MVLTFCYIYLKSVKACKPFYILIQFCYAWQYMYSIANAERIIARPISGVSVRPAVWMSVCLSVHHTLVLSQD